MDGRLDMTRRPLVRFCVPGEPVPKGRPRARVEGGFAKIYTPSKTRKYEIRVRDCARDAMAKAGAGLTVAPVSVTIIACFPIPASLSKKARARIEAGHAACMAVADLDNVVKSITDAMNEVVYADDRQVTLLTARKDWSATPRVLVKVETLEAADLLAGAPETMEAAL